MVVHVAIVEDEEIHQKTLKEYLERYAKENGTAFHIAFGSSQNFV